MAFFDDLGKKLTQASQSTIQKTKGIADTAKITALISEEEKKIKINYYEIGKLYVSLHEEDAEVSFAGLVQTVRESYEKIEEYRQQISDIKGYIRCEKCGAEVSTSAAFCSSCGTPVSISVPAKDQTAPLCTNCGTVLILGMKFCTKCGTVVPQTGTALATTEETERVCDNCGAKMSGDTDFCTECGTKL